MWMLIEEQWDIVAKSDNRAAGVCERLSDGGGKELLLQVKSFKKVKRTDRVLIYKYKRFYKENISLNV